MEEGRRILEIKADRMKKSGRFPSSPEIVMIVLNELSLQQQTIHVIQKQLGLEDQEQLHQDHYQQRIPGHIDAEIIPELIQIGRNRD